MYKGLSKGQFEYAVGHTVEVGNVYRLHLGEEEGVKEKNAGDNGRNKYIIVIGTSETELLCGVVLINSEINKGLPQHIKDKHILIKAEKYAFLGGKNRYVDCSSIKELSYNKFRSLFEHSFYGKIKADDMDVIICNVIEYENAQPKLLKRYSLL